MTTDTFTALLVLVVIGTTIWVAFDVHAHDQPRGQVFSWFVGCLLLWIVVFPAYLMTRSRWHRDAQRDLIQSAAGQGPPGYARIPAAPPTQRPSGALKWLGITAAGFVVYLASALSTAFTNGLPSVVQGLQVAVTIAALLVCLGGLVMMVISLARRG